MDYLTLASQLTIEDRTLALDLWRTSVDKGIDDDHVWMAFGIGERLGVGVELKPLVQRLAALGTEGKGGIQAVGLKEFIDRSAQRRQQLEQVWQQLQRGEAPNLVALNVTGIGLARAFHRIPLITATRADGTSAGPVNQRFGGRNHRFTTSSARSKVAAQCGCHGHSERRALQIVATYPKLSSPRYGCHKTPLLR